MRLKCLDSCNGEWTLNCGWVIAWVWLIRCSLDIFSICTLDLRLALFFCQWSLYTKTVFLFLEYRIFSNDYLDENVISVDLCSYCKIFPAFQTLQKITFLIAYYAGNARMNFSVFSMQPFCITCILCACNRLNTIENSRWGSK